MAYEYGVAANGPEDEWFDGPTVVVVARGSHDCSRLVQALRSGNSEQADLAVRIAGALNRTPLGRRVATLLKRHGGADLTDCKPMEMVERIHFQAVSDEGGIAFTATSHGRSRWELLERRAEVEQWCARYPHYHLTARRQWWHHTEAQWEDLDPDVVCPPAPEVPDVV